MIPCCKNLYEIIAYKNDNGDWVIEKFLVIGFEVTDEELKPVSLSRYGGTCFEDEVHRGILHEDGTVQRQNFSDMKFFVNMSDFVDSLY